MVLAKPSHFISFIVNNELLRSISTSRRRCRCKGRVETKAGLSFQARWIRMSLVLGAVFLLELSTGFSRRALSATQTTDGDPREYAENAISQAADLRSNWQASSFHQAIEKYEE